jgi:predicted phage terminase large subunit-like protein
VLNNYGARISAASTEKAIRGARYQQHRPDLIILDDIEDINSVKTQDSRDKLYQWFTSEVVPLGDIHTRIIVVGNLLHRDSLLMRLKEDIEKNKIDGSYHEYPLLDSKGKIQWPGKYPDKAAIECEKRKVNDDRTWHREYLLKIISTEDQVVKHEWIQTYSTIPQAILGGYYEIRIGVDMAASLKTRADYSTLVPMLVAWVKGKKKIYVLPNIFCKRVSFPEFMDAIKALYTELECGRPITFVVESNGMQKGLVQLLQDADLPVKDVHVATDKRSRLAIVSGLIRSGTIVFPLEGSRDLIAQLVNFGSEKHDDLVDGFTIAASDIVSDFKPVGSYGDYADEPSDIWYDSPTFGMDDMQF